MLTVTLLGTAATLPQPDRALSAAVFSCRGRHILLDCGEGTQLALHRQRISPMKIDLIALTHFHGDHILGLPGLLQTMEVMDRKEALVITGPTGLTDVMRSVLALADELSFPVRLAEGADPLPMAALHSSWPVGTTLTAFETVHRVASQGYALHIPRMRQMRTGLAAARGIPKALWPQLQSGRTVTVGKRTIRPEEVCGPERKGLTAVFTGDTAPCRSIIDAARDAELLIMDATYADDAHAEKAARYGHSTYGQTALCAAEAGVKRLWLTHFSARLDEPEAYLDAARAHFPQAECGADGMRILLTYPQE